MDNTQVISKHVILLKYYNGVKEEEWLKILMECIKRRNSEGMMAMRNALITRLCTLLGFWETTLLWDLSYPMPTSINGVPSRFQLASCCWRRWCGLFDLWLSSGVCRWVLHGGCHWISALISSGLYYEKNQMITFFYH